ncbi:YfmQ family protein [Bacillus sp. FJAT-49736]|uniref:YfmQ family protein n=1 Tax=Bacillus sp. FJAT-49736 TaxID=2833582 RepID=UPI001BC97088|nr:YfmQ family protein [Bacillus sp. FJAT-49736]MBS4174300.1 YfmQ family protein [Bacillus sp. FJAT-49736]
MTWIFILSLVLAGSVKIILTCPPTSAVEWLLSKFELHSKLQEASTIITLDGKRLEGEDKQEFIHSFNEATFLERYYVHPGNEKLILQPDNGGTPLVIDTKRGKINVKLFVYRYEDHVDVVKQYRKKMLAYSVRSDSLQRTFPAMV